MKRVNMATAGGLCAPYFYLRLLVIFELGVMIPFKPFEVDFLATINVAPSKTTPNMWTILRDFKIIRCNLGVSHTFWVFLYFFSI